MYATMRREKPPLALQAMVAKFAAMTAATPSS
jgi:hypothetical protein